QHRGDLHEYLFRPRLHRGVDVGAGARGVAAALRGGRLLFRSVPARRFRLRHVPPGAGADAYVATTASCRVGALSRRWNFSGLALERLPLARVWKPAPLTDSIPE